MVEKVVVYKVGEQMFGSADEAKEFELHSSLGPLTENAPFVSVSQGLQWLTANADAIIAALRPVVPKATTGARRGRRTKAEMAAAREAEAAATPESQPNQAIAA